MTPDDSLGSTGGNRNRVAVTLQSQALAAVELIGEHDLGQYQVLTAALDRATARRPNLLVDLTHCAFIDSTGISLLLRAYDDLSSAGGQFALVIPPEDGPVSRVAQIVSLAEIVPVYDSRAAAVASFEQTAEPQVPG
jgi:anti-anti-sigma factor